jgi:hypothetical protein
MREVLVGSGWDATGVPLPTGAPVPVPPAVAAAEGTVVTALVTRFGDLVVDEWCDPLLAEVGGVVFDVRAATARQAQAEARLVSCYLWGAAELAARAGGSREHDRREWGARGMLAELAVALHLPEATLARRLARSTRLEAMPGLLAEHRRGAVSAWHLDVVLDVMRGVSDPQVLAQADAFLAERASRMTAPQLRASARGWRDRHVPRTDEQRRANLADRRVDVTPADEDLCWLTALIPAAQALAIDARLDAIAAEVDGPDEPRTRAQVRADALVDLLLVPGARPGLPSGTPLVGADEVGVEAATEAAGQLAEPPAVADALRGRAEDPRIPGDEPGGPAAETVRPAPGDERGGPAADESVRPAPDDACGLPAWVAGVRAEVVLTVPVLSLLGHSDEPAHLEGVGPIDMDTATLLAANAPSFVRVLTHPETGAVLSVGRDRYRIPEDLRRTLQIRDVTCRFPGCRRPARRCDVDHVRAWADGGPTECCNLQCLCEKHHRLKHEMGWAPTLEPDGAVRWRSPIGLSYWTQPGGVWPPRPAPPPARPPAASSPAASGYPDEPPF